MIILNMYVPAGVIIAIVALFLFACGFLAGYLFGSLSAAGKKTAGERKNSPA